MNEDIRIYVQHCDKCQRMNTKFLKSDAKLHPVPIHPEVWKQVSSSPCIGDIGLSISG